MAATAKAAREPHKLKEHAHGVVDLGVVGAGSDIGSVSIEDAVGALDWLFDPLDSGGGGVADFTDDSLDGEGGVVESLGSATQLDHSALSYGASETGGRHERLRRVKPIDASLPASIKKARHKLETHKSILTAEEYFGGDDDAVFLAVTVREIVLGALLDNDLWCYEWIFGAAQVETDERPPRQKVLEFFDARDVVLQTRVQFQMLRDGHSVNMAFPCKSLDRSFLWQLTGLLAEHKDIFALEHALTIMELMWGNPGISESRLWSLYENAITARPGQAVFKVDEASFSSSLVFLEMGYMCSRNAKTNGWYLTGKNPARHAEDLRKDLKRFNMASMNRGWSSWF